MTICTHYSVGDSLAIIKTELKSQKKHVRSLQKKSLWGKILEEVRKVPFMYLDIVGVLTLELLYLSVPKIMLLLVVFPLATAEQYRIVTVPCIH